MIYLDNGATTFPKPGGMIEAMGHCMAVYCGNPGRSGHTMSMRTGEEVYKARRALAELFGIESAERIVFTNNASEALNLGMKGVLRPGDHVVTTSMEHNSVLRPLRTLQERLGIEQTILRCRPDGTLNPDAVRRAIRSNTRLVVCTHASNVVGTILPVEEIGRIIRETNGIREAEGREAILFMVDSAQSAGSVPIDVRRMQIDLLAAPGHKGLLGPLGTGFLYTREGIELRSLMEGGTGTASKERLQPLDFPEGYEVGTVNAPGIIGLRYSAEFVKRVGVEKIGSYECSLISPLDEALRNMDGITVYGPCDCRMKTGIVTFNITGREGFIGEKGCEEVCAALNDDYGIAVRGGFHCAGLAHKTIGTWECGAVRLSVSPFTTVKEIRTAADAVYRISRR